MTSLAGDLRDRARVEQTVAAIAPEVVFHLAGRRSAASGLKRPLDSFDTNVTGTLNLLHALRSNPRLRAVVVVCFAEPVTVRAAGGDVAAPLSASLACAAIIAESFGQCYLQPADGIGLGTLQLPELLAAGDFAAERLLPSLHRRMVAGQVATVDAPTLTQPLLNVLDALEGCLGLAAALVQQPKRFARGWTLRSDTPAAWPRARIAQHVAERLGGRWSAGIAATPGLALDGEPHATEPYGSEPDGAGPGAGRIDPRPARPAPLAAALGWRSRLDVASALDWALDGYRRLEADADWRFFDEQRQRYRALAALSTPGERLDAHPLLSAAKANHVSASA